jgi:phosphatidylserine/phosphatidylglycerophosphate/cardiolipin synthase-like enzyme
MELPVLSSTKSPTRRFRADLPPTFARGSAELVVNADHFRRIVLDGILKAKVSVDILTADFKAMLVPTGTRRRAESIVSIFRKLADKGVEIRLMHSGVPSAPALLELKRELPERLTIRRCPRLHAKTVVIDCRAMYLGSANLTGAGLGAKADGKRNFEMGIWTESPDLIDAALEQFNTLWEGERCPTCKRRNVCPMPLEEPGN